MQHDREKLMVKPFGILAVSDIVVLRKSPEITKALAAKTSTGCNLRTEHIKNFWNVIVIVVDFFITLPFNTIEGKVNHYDYDVSKILNKTPLEIFM